MRAFPTATNAIAYRSKKMDLVVLAVIEFAKQLTLKRL